MKSFLTGILTVITVITLVVGYFNMKMLYSGQHIIFLKTDASCGIIDQQTSDYLEVTASILSSTMKRK